MELSGYDVPEDLLYTREHEWARQAGPNFQVGVTDYAAKALNDVVYVTLPKVGERLLQMKPMGTLESIKAVSELYSPLSGEVVRVNGELLSHPELVNKSPYTGGWIVEMKPEKPAEKATLLDFRGYASFLETLLKK